MALMTIELGAGEVVQAMGADANFAMDMWTHIFEALDCGAVLDDFLDTFGELPQNEQFVNQLRNMADSLEARRPASKPYDPTFHSGERSSYPLWRFAKSEYKAEVIAAYKAGKIIERAPSKGSTLSQWIEMRHANFNGNEIYRVRPGQ